MADAEKLLKTAGKWDERTDKIFSVGATRGTCPWLEAVSKRKEEKRDKERREYKKELAEAKR